MANSMLPDSLPEKPARLQRLDPRWFVVGLVVACSQDAVGAACDVDADCGEDLICDRHGEAGTCQTAHAHDSASSAPEHTHDLLPVDAGQAVPSVSLSAAPDSVTGWNLHVSTTNFELAAPTATARVSDPTLLRGHAHLFIDGTKTTRLYDSWYYLPALPPGEHELRVELSSHDHRVLWFGGQFIEDRLMLDASAQQGAQQGAAKDGLEAHDDLELSIDVLPDPTGGHNLHASTSSISLGLERDAESESLGMLELFIDGEPSGRVYSEWHYLGSLQPGRHEVLVRLRDHEGRPLTRGGEPVEARAEFEAP